MQSPPYIQWPIPSKEELFFAFTGMVGLILFAIGAELQRQRFMQSRARKRDWQAVDDIMNEKDLTADEKTYLRDLLERYARKDPQHAITSRRPFERVVDAEMARLAQANRADLYEATGQVLRDIRSKLGLDYAPIGQAILSTRDLYIAQVMDLQHAGTEHAAPFVLKRVNEAYLYLRAKGDGHRPPGDMVPGAISKVHMWREEDARYAFNLRFERYDHAEEAWVFHHADKLNRYQARAHFRIFYDHAVTLGLASPPKNGNEPHSQGGAAIDRIRGRVTSLSAGGLAVQIQQPIDKKLRLHTELDLADEGTVDTVAEIVAIHALPGGRYLVRAHFIAMDDEVRDQIARYVTRRQQAQSAAQAAEAN